MLQHAGTLTPTLCYVIDISIDISVDIDIALCSSAVLQPGMNAILGPTGSGKSSLSIEYFVCLKCHTFYSCTCRILIVAGDTFCNYSFCVSLL